MIWIPINQLSNKQKDGNWWVFYRKTQNGSYWMDVARYASLGEFDEDAFLIEPNQTHVWVDCECEDVDLTRYNAFLSLPFPYIPETHDQKMINSLNNLETCTNTALNISENYKEDETFKDYTPEKVIETLSRHFAHLLNLTQNVKKIYNTKD